MASPMRRKRSLSPGSGDERGSSRRSVRRRDSYATHAMPEGIPSHNLYSDEAEPRPKHGSSSTAIIPTTLQVLVPEDPDTSYDNAAAMTDVMPEPHVAHQVSENNEVVITSAEIETLRGPGCPGTVRQRDNGTLSKLPPNLDALAAFKKLRNDWAVSDEEAFIRLIQQYDVPLRALNQISSSVLPVSFSNVKFEEIATHCWLDATAEGRDIDRLEVFRSRLPKTVFRNIYQDVAKATIQYGRMSSHDNEEARSRYIASIFSEIVCLFCSAIQNKPESILESPLTKRGRIEHHFIAMQSISIIFFEVKKVLMVGKAKLDVIAQVLAESAACDYTNGKLDHWVPILGVLCDGEKFEFLVYESGLKKIYSSGNAVGIHDEASNPREFVASIKRTSEYIFDFFLMAYINGLRSFGYKSNIRGEAAQRKRDSTPKWMDALRLAEEAHFLCRQASAVAQGECVGDAERIAEEGVQKLKESVLHMPGLETESVETFWNEEVAWSA